MPTNDIPDSEHHVLLPFFDDDKEIPTEKYNPLTTARQNCITNDQNSFKNTETHNNNNLTPQNIDLVSNPSQVKKEKDVALNPDEWKKGTTLVIGDLMLAGLREAKLSRNKKIKVCFFPGAKTEDLQYHLIPYLKKKPDNNMIHSGTNDSSYKSEDLIYKEFLNVKQIIHKHHPNCKNIVVSSLVIRTDKQEANSILKKYNSILKQKEKKVIFYSNITPSYLNKDGLHLNFNGSTVLAGNLLSRIRMF